MTGPAATTCPVCGANAVTVVREHRQVVAEDGTSLEFNDEFSRCQQCGVDHYTRDQSLTSSRARAAALRTHEGLLSPQEIRAIRDRLGYTQAQLEQVLGVGPKTVVRWEKGTVRQSRLADRFLRTLAAYPQAIIYDTVAGALRIPENIAAYDAAQTALGYANGTVVARGGVLYPAGVRVFATSSMFIAGGALQMHDLWTEPVQIIGETEQAGWELKVDDDIPALCEAA